MGVLPPPSLRLFPSCTPALPVPSAHSPFPCPPQTVLRETDLVRECICFLAAVINDAGEALDVTLREARPTQPLKHLPRNVLSGVPRNPAPLSPHHQHHNPLPPPLSKSRADVRSAAPSPARGVRTHAVPRSPLARRHAADPAAGAAEPRAGGGRAAPGAVRAHPAQAAGGRRRGGGGR